MVNLTCEPAPGRRSKAAAAAAAAAPPALATVVEAVVLEEEASEGAPAQRAASNNFFRALGDKKDSADEPCARPGESCWGRTGGAEDVSPGGTGRDSPNNCARLDASRPALFPPVAGILRGFTTLSSKLHTGWKSAGGMGGGQCFCMPSGRLATMKPTGGRRPSEGHLAYLREVRVGSALPSASPCLLYTSPSPRD